MHHNTHFTIQSQNSNTREHADYQHAVKSQLITTNHNEGQVIR